MSRERALRRAAREAEAARAREQAEARRVVQVRRRRGRAALGRQVRRTLGVRPVRVRSAGRRALVRRWVPVVAAVGLAHVLLWLLLEDVRASLVAVGVTALAAPVVWVLVTDGARRRRTGYRRRP